MRKNKNLFQLFILFFCISMGFISCQNKEKELWNTEIKITEKAKVINFSEDFFNPNLSFEDFKKKYPWFEISDEEYITQKKDTAHINIYKEAIKEINTENLTQEFSEMFSRVKYYFPDFKAPEIYLYSSGLQGITEPIFFREDMNMISIDISAFLGENHKYYRGLDFYLQKSMNPENLVPKTTEIVAETFIIPNPQENKFIDKMLLSGKIKILQNAFLPRTPEHLKMNYTTQQYEWTVANEENIWNYFVEQDLIFSDDAQLAERFLSIAPFSKFYTEVDQKSSPQVGVFIGWQISKAFFNKKPKTTLSEFLKMNATDIFNQSNYKPE